MTHADLIARLRAGTVTPEICEAAAVALEELRKDVFRLMEISAELGAKNGRYIYLLNGIFRAWKTGRNESMAVWADPIENTLKGTTK